MTQILRPIRNAVSNFSLVDSFDFVNRLHSIDLKDKEFCSFDVKSLFTNVPLQETINLFETIQLHFSIELPIDFVTLKSLILLCTHNVQFSFNDKYYFEKDGVAMGSPLGPVLADIFMGYVENFMINISNNDPIHYYRYVDDTFLVFRNQADIYAFLDKMNTVHSNLEFTCELSRSNSLPFLDVLVIKKMMLFLQQYTESPRGPASISIFSVSLQSRTSAISCGFCLIVQDASVPPTVCKPSWNFSTQRLKQRLSTSLHQEIQRHPGTKRGFLRT